MSKWGERVSKSCGWCETVMVLKPAIAREQNYCSRSCALRARAVAEGKTGRQRMVRCRGCGDCSERTVRKHKDSGEYCSRECYNGWKIRMASERAALRRIAANWKPVPDKTVEREIEALRRIANWVPGRRPTVRPCSGCGVKMVGLGNYSRTCEPCKVSSKAKCREVAKSTDWYKAAKRANKAMRRAKERGATADRIDPIRVFDRDGWKCHMCGRSTPKRLRGTYENLAPELDHVIPLSAGGSHTWINVRCSCRKCNILKSDKPFGQLDLGWAA